MAEVFDLVYHGQGGFIYSEVMDMPIQIRRYNIKKVNEFLELVREKQEANQTVTADKPLISRPGIPDSAPISAKPTYTSTAKSRR